MGQAKRNKAIWLAGKAGRFVRLLVLISKRYTEHDAIEFAKRRFISSNERRER